MPISPLIVIHQAYSAHDSTLSADGVFAALLSDHFDRTHTGRLPCQVVGTLK